jgi:transcriptional regulator with XRE-family HTH domain
MNEDSRDRLLAELIEAPSQRAEIMQNTDMAERDRIEAASLAETADLLWEVAHGAPPLEDDPVAAMLGLVVDPQCVLDSKALARARKRAGLTVSQVAEQLRTRGWKIQHSDVFRWETRSAFDVAPALIQAVADIVGTPVESLVADPRADTGSDRFGAVRRDPVFQQLVRRWARARHVSLTVAAAALETRMVAAVHRGDSPDEEQMLRSLDALVSAIEGDDKG